MQRLIRIVLIIAMAALVMQLPSAAWSKNTTPVKRQPGVLKKAPAGRGNASEIKPTFKPDLVISTINYSPGSPAEGDEITLWVFVKNTGMAPSGASGVKVRVGGEANPPMIPVPPLNASQKFQYSKKVTFNTSGNYIVSVTADAGNAVAESSEINNIKKATIKVKSKLPDLVISKANYSPGSPNTNSEVTFWLFVKNIGLSRSEPCFATITMNSVYLGSAGQQVPALNPGQEWRFSKKFILGKAGNITATITADMHSQVDESKEYNNQKKITIAVQQGPKPDLVVTKINFSPASPKQHEQVTVWYFVKNIGQGVSLPCNLLAGSSMNSYSGMHSERVPRLDPGREWRFQGLFTSNGAGSFKLKAVIDSDNKINESNENNNVRFKDIIVKQVK